jgi:hypothetical protein
MPTEPASDEDMIAQQLKRMQGTLEDINARIARLAIALHIPLKTNHDVERAMHRHQVPAVPFERRVSPDRRNEVREGSTSDRRVGLSADRRLAAKEVELRGLLVLRYDIETRYAEQIGATATRQLLIDAETHLAREGFTPGADGVDLKSLTTSTD